VTELRDDAVYVVKNWYFPKLVTLVNKILAHERFIVFLT